MNTQDIQFVWRGEIVKLRNVAATRTLLEVLREDMGRNATKEGCNEGDCGACTVVLAHTVGEQLHYRAVNACIRLAHSIHGMALWTAEDLISPDGNLHPVQQALLENHASQCGFCTPGFVMSLFGMYQNHVANDQTITRELAQQELSGNLCRCTGYRPIFDAAQTMGNMPQVHVDEASLLAQLEKISSETLPHLSNASYNAPRRLTDLLALRSANPKAQLVAGCTDVGLWINKMHMQFDQILDLSRVQELRCVQDHPQHIAIGAAVTLSDAFAALIKQRPQLKRFADRFAGLPVRNSGTLGGNVANGSPIGDSMPLLIALGASVVLMSVRGSREMALENLYTGYRQNVMAADEVLACINVPKPMPGEFLRVYKVSKRFDDDISAVCLAIRIQLNEAQITHASIGVGGVAATPVRASQTESILVNQPWALDTVQTAMANLRGEFAPISDMRASAAYRLQILGNLLQRFWLESQGDGQVNLESFTLTGEDA